MRVMVTGGAGFIGSTLVDRLLAEGCDVDVIDDLSTGSLANLADARAQRSRKFTFHRLDVRSPQLADIVAHRKPEVIFHLAAQLDVRVSVAKPLFDAEVNVLGSLNVCESALAAGTRKVVFAGSGGTLYGVPESRAGAREPSAAPDVAVRRVEEGRGRLPPLLPRGPGSRVHRARARQRLRPAAGPPRRGRGGRDLRRPHARRQSADRLRRRQADPRLRVRRRRRRRVRARHREGRRPAHEHRHRRRDERARALRRHGAAHRFPGRRPSGRRNGRASCCARRSTRVAPPSTSGGSRGRRSTTAWRAPSTGSAIATSASVARRGHDRGEVVGETQREGDDGERRWVGTARGNTALPPT